MSDNAVFEVSFYDLPGRRLALAGATLSRRLDNGRGIWRLEAPRPDGALLELEGLGGPMALPKQIGRALPAFLRGDRPEQFLRLRVHPGDDRNDIEVLEGMPSNGSLVIGPGGLGATVLELVAESAAAADGPIGRLRSVLARQYAEILRHDPGVRLDLDPEDVHRMRVAARRGAQCCVRLAPSSTRTGRSLCEQSSSGSAARSVRAGTSTCSSRACESRSSGSSNRNRELPRRWSTRSSRSV